MAAARTTSKKGVATMATMDSNIKGDISMACVIAALTKKGISVAVPTTDNKRYDLVMDYNGKLYRMQVKTILYKPEKMV
ncbi:group I intron-associated PD-(D/E)XK endonuclease [Bacillus spizizenii]|nr:group I intron-associated PD-(D/E)XK endonuclease [Bacillus spizizenii]